MIWLTPIAWLGLTLLAVPVLIHLLTLRQTRNVPFPTLRFLRPTRLAAIRRRALQNWFLLALRMSTLAAAVSALAAPVLVSPSRQEQWQRRVARALVIAPGTSSDEVASLVEAERRDSFALESFTPEGRVADGLRDAALWLRHQPPATQEIVVVGDLRQGALAAADLSLVPMQAGLRFLPVPSAGPTHVDLYFRESNTRWRADVTLSDTETSVSYTRDGMADDAIRVRAARDDEDAAAAALNAVFARGIEVDRDAERRVIVVFAGGNTKDLTLASPPPKPWMRASLAALPDMTGGANGDVLVVQTERRASAPEAARVLERVARIVFEQDRAAFETLPLPAQTLAAWSRPPGAVERPQVQDEGDRRWLWGAVLALMALEMAARRARSRVDDGREIEDARVA